VERRIAWKTDNESYLIGSGVAADFLLSDVSQLADLEGFLNEHSGKHIFFAVSYELGMQLLAVPSDPLKKREALPLLQVWVPASIGRLQQKHYTTLDGPQPEWVREFAILRTLNTTGINWKTTLSKEQYLSDIKAIQQEIQLGNCYELNYCIRINASGKPAGTGIEFFQQLNNNTHAPKAVYYEDEQFLVASASPERFIRKEGDILISEPIKGTAPRNSDPTIDAEIAKSLQHSLKDTTENVMIVDLVRNDLSKVASKGSVEVTALNKLHSFETVHQLISTVQCDLKAGTSFTDILKALFPMGSMTGAPKKAAVELSEKYEHHARNWYSGSFGYMAPNGDFDSNVVIRTVFYDKKQERFSCMVGGAITSLSDPEEEWEECKTKVGKILNIFGECTW